MIREALHGWIIEAEAVPAPSDRWTVELIVSRGPEWMRLPELGATFPTRQAAEQAAIDVGKTWVQRRGTP